MAQFRTATSPSSGLNEAELRTRVAELEGELQRLKRQLSQQGLFEEALLQSQAHLRNILDSLFVFIVVLQPDGRVLKANRAPLDMAGLLLDDVAGRQYLDCAWWKEDAELTARLKNALERARQGQASRFDLNVVTKAGKSVTLDYMLTPMYDENGTLIRIICCAVDISDRNRFERALSESESRFRSTFENAAVGMAQLRTDGRWLAVNEKLCQIFGYSRQELLSLSFREISHPDDRSDEMTLPQRMLTGKLAPQSIEKRYIRKDGSIVWATVTASHPIRMDDGSGYLIAVVEDITARKRAETALRESEHKFRTLADGIPQLAWMADPSGWIYWYNQRWYDYTGTTQEQTLGWNWQSVHDPVELPNVLNRWHASLEKGTPFDMIFPLRAADGTFRTFLTRVEPVIGPEGQIAGWFGTNTDITEQKRVEEALRRSNSDLIQFAYVASHDLQEPLRTVTTLTQLLARHNEANFDERSKQWVDHIVRSSKRMGTLICDLLAYSRTALEEGLPTEQVDCNALLEDLLSELQTQIEEAEGSIHRERLPIVEANRVQLSQVFQNLISNALRFRNAGIPLEVHISAERLPQEWCFRVADNGQGFDPAYVDRVFGIFKRLHGNEVQGNGIGLAVCKTVVNRHGGRIWVETEEGKGASFFFTLPASVNSLCRRSGEGVAGR